MTDAVATPTPTPSATPTPAPAARPENVPEKFWDATKGAMNTDALLQSYTELEKKVSTPAAPVDADESAANEKAADAALKSAGLNLSTFTDEYAEKGTLSPESYAALEAAGFPKSFVDSHIEGQLALGDSFTSAAHEAAGGLEGYTAMSDWARAALTPAELAAYNDGVMGSKADMVKTVKGLRDRYEAAVGKEPALLQASSTPSGDTFTTQQQVTAAMKDKRWGNDPAYTKMITDKIGRSTY